MALLYDAADYGFATTAIAALRAAGIPCYTEQEGQLGEAIDHLTGLPVRDGELPVPEGQPGPEPDPKDFELSPKEEKELQAAEQERSLLSGRVSRSYCIYVDNDEDYQRASELLLKLGAAREPMISAKEVEWINRWTTTIALITGVLVAMYIWENWKH
jgi:hypothetical protein